MNMQTILLTGVTGQVVSEVALDLQKRGHRLLYVIRPTATESAVMRLEKILPTIREGLDIAIEGDITLPLGGFSAEDIDKWAGKVDKILHGAAAISFEDKDAESVRATNLGGTANMLKLADTLGVTDFHYISTAYISGSAPVFRETDLDIGQDSFNAYERSKMAAEKLVHGWCGGRFSIYRLPTVLGSSADGRVLTYHSYYGFFMPFWRMLKSWRRRWDADKEDCTSKGVTFDKQGVMNIPLYIDCSETSVLNMVCVDWVAQMMSELVSLPTSDQTYHLVDPAPMRVKDVIVESLAHMGVTGIVYDADELPPLSPLLAKVQEGIKENIRIYQQYIKHGSIFLCDNLVSKLGEKYVPHPVVDSNMLRKMLGYAMLDDFGKRQK